MFCGLVSIVKKNIIDLEDTTSRVLFETLFMGAPTSRTGMEASTGLWAVNLMLGRWTF